MSKRVAKECNFLIKRLPKILESQVSFLEFSDNDLCKLLIKIIPKKGLYKNGHFVFLISISENYPFSPPDVECLTEVYHPNIYEEDVCINILKDDWSQTLGIEDVISALVFLFYEPNRNDPLNSNIGIDLTEEEFEKNVKTSLLGGDINGYIFQPNEGFLKAGINDDDDNDNNINASGNLSNHGDHNQTDEYVEKDAQEEINEPPVLIRQISNEEESDAFFRTLIQPRFKPIPEDFNDQDDVEENEEQNNETENFQNTNPNVFVNINNISPGQPIHFLYRTDSQGRYPHLNIARFSWYQWPVVVTRVMWMHNVLLHVLRSRHIQFASNFYTDNGTYVG